MIVVAVVVAVAVVPEVVAVVVVAMVERRDCRGSGRVGGRPCPQLVWGLGRWSPLSVAVLAAVVAAAVRVVVVSVVVAAMASGECWFVVEAA